MPGYVQPLNYNVAVPAPPVAVMRSLLSLPADVNFFSGYDVRQATANTVQVTRRYTPLSGLMAQLMKDAEVLTIAVYQRGPGSYLHISGRASQPTAAAVSFAINRLLSGPHGPRQPRPQTPGPQHSGPQHSRPQHSQPQYLRPQPTTPPTHFDQPAVALLLRARRARELVLASKVHRENMIGHAAGEMTLRRHEEEIGLVLQDIVRLRAHLLQSQSSGPMTAAVLDPQQRILAQAQDSVESRVRAMERYAAQVQAADDARLDWENAMRLAGLNDKFLDLAARTAADQYAIGELKDLTAQAQAAHDAFRDSLHEASMAAEALALPAEPTDQPSAK